MDNTYRYERKFILPKNYSVDSIESVLIKSRFSFTKQYEDRYVNSIYFDNKNLDSVKENLDGVVSKKKIRKGSKVSLNDLLLKRVKNNNKILENPDTIIGKIAKKEIQKNKPLKGSFFK